MPVRDLLLSVIDRKGISLAMELRTFMSDAHPGKSISKPGYLKQRMKLNPEAFRYLYHMHNRQFYADTDTPAPQKTYRGFPVLAVDGTRINVPTTPETLENYGTPCVGEGRKQAQLGLGCIYDVLNHFILESDICPYGFNEAEVAEAQVQRLRDTIGDRFGHILVMDRGYPSTPLFMRLIDSGTYFAARLNSAIYSAEQAALRSDDEDVIIALTDRRREKHRGTPNEQIMASRESFVLRFVRVWLDKDRYEILATNLPREMFPRDCFAEIYHMRWGIETSYETLKSKLQLENFTGTKPVLIEQDIYGSIYVFNLAEHIAMEVEEENTQTFANDCKYPMKVNRNICTGIVKNDLIYAFMQEEPDRRHKLMQQVYDDISRNIVPVRDGRHFERDFHKTGIKYSNTYKRSY